jgi:hypothetical protein
MPACLPASASAHQNHKTAKTHAHKNVLIFIAPVVSVSIGTFPTSSIVIHTFHHRLGRSPHYNVVVISRRKQLLAF